MPNPGWKATIESTLIRWKAIIESTLISWKPTIETTLFRWIAIIESTLIRWLVHNRINTDQPSSDNRIHTNQLKAGLGTPFFFIRYVTFFSVLNKKMFRSFPFFSRVFGDLWNPKERSVLFKRTEKNVPFFLKERKRTRECSFF